MQIRQRNIRGLQSKDSTSAIVGLGYVGLPFAEVGYRVLGIDKDAEEIALLLDGESYVERIPGAPVLRARATGSKASADFAGAPKQTPSSSACRHDSAGTASPIRPS